MLNKIRNIVPSLITSLLRHWPYVELIRSKDLIDAELKRRLANDPCKGCYNCSVRDDTDEDDDGEVSDENEDEVQVEQAVPGTVKEKFYIIS